MPVPSIIRHPGLLRYVVRHPHIFAQGWSEARNSGGETFDNDVWSPRSIAYDAGRDLRLMGRA